MTETKSNRNNKLETNNPCPFCGETKEKFFKVKIDRTTYRMCKGCKDSYLDFYLKPRR